MVNSIDFLYKELIASPMPAWWASPPPTAVGGSFMQKKDENLNSPRSIRCRNLRASAPLFSLEKKVASTSVL